MSFVRPEAAVALRRWAETLVGLALLAIGTWIFWQARGLEWALGVFAVAIGLVLCFTGIRQALFRSTQEEAPGVVEIDEGRIVYLGPILGGSVALADVRRITHHRARNGEAFWQFQGGEPAPLIIPAGAQGVEALLDACTVLPQFNAGSMVRAVQRRTYGLHEIWHHPTLT